MTQTIEQKVQNADLYEQIDRVFNERLGVDVGFDSLVSTAPYEMDLAQVQGFADRYQTLKQFQQQTLELFKSSLTGDHDPAIARMVLGDLPPHLAEEHHRNLSDQQHLTPLFFRTDEPVPGKMSEVQCPGSGWCLHEQVRQLYQDNPEIYGQPTHFPIPLADSFSQVLRGHLGKEPIIHHLTENASRPHGMRYFIQRTRDHGIRYYSYDRDVAPSDCNLVRSHDFVSVLHHNFFADRMRRCDLGEVTFDLPPSALFDGKLIMALPFWRQTRDAYTDAVRSVFPYTTVIEPSGIELEDGSRIAIDEFCERPGKQRDYYIKYAGTDIAINWGSKAVFLASSGSRVQCHQLMEQVEKDWRQGRYWVLQTAQRKSDRVPVVNRQGKTYELEGYAKYSAFYGPTGLLGILVMHKNFQKVHGSEGTAMSVVY